MITISENANEPSREYLFKSPPMQIGKTMWRFVVYKTPKDVFTDFEFYSKTYKGYVQRRREYKDFVVVLAHSWNRSDTHKNYDFNDGCFAGLPKTLVTLYKMYFHEFEKAAITYPCLKGS